MKTIILSIFLLVVLATLCRGDNTCGKPFELLNCNAEVSKAGDNFCTALAAIRKCFVDDAKCPEDFFRTIQEQAEKQQGIKCGACSLPIPSVLLLTAVGLGYYFLSNNRN